MKSTPPSTRSERAPLPFVRVKRIGGREYDYFRIQRGGRDTYVRLRGARHSAEYVAHYNELRQGIEQEVVTGTVASALRMRVMSSGICTCGRKKKISPMAPAPTHGKRSAVSSAPLGR